MYTIPITDQIDLDHMTRAVTPYQQIWETEITKFRCPEHVMQARLTMTNTGPMIESCCEGHAAFCRYALRSIIAAELKPIH